MKNYSDTDFEFDFELEFDGFLELEKGTGGATGGSSSTRRPPALIEFVAPDRYAFKSTTLPSAHNKVITRVAHLLAFSSIIGSPIRNVEVIGHADKAGNDATNVAIGLERARKVSDLIIAEMNRIRKDSSKEVRITPRSRGESQRVDKTGTPAGNALNRRVQIMLPPNCQTFFAQLDLQTFPGSDVIGVKAHPNVADTADRLRMVDAVANHELSDRLRKRAQMALDGDIMKKTPLSKPAGSQLDKDVRALSSLQLDLFRKYLPGGGGVFSRRALTNCFQRFANGEMRSPHSDFPGQGVNEPDSQFFFLFAEFAFLCYDMGIQKALWLRALRSMVGAQEIFMHVYRKNPPATPPPVGSALPPAGAPATTPLSEFKHSNFKPIGTSTTKGRGQSDAKRKKDLVKKYQSMGIEQLYAAAAQNLLRAQKL